MFHLGWDKAPGPPPHPSFQTLCRFGRSKEGTSITLFHFVEQEVFLLHKSVCVCVYIYVCIEIRNLAESGNPISFLSSPGQQYRGPEALLCSPLGGGSHLPLQT